MRNACLALLLLLAACSEPGPPGDLLPREQFKRVLLESQLIEARLNHEMVIDRRLDSPAEAYYDSLFAQQGVDRARFKATFDHYTQRPDELKAVYEEIIDELGQRKDGLR